MHQLVSQLVFIGLYGVSYGVVLFTISIGLVVTLGLMRVINLAHGAFAAVGGYIAVSLANDFGLSFALGIPAAVIVVAGLSVIVERLCYADLYTAGELDQVLMTIGLMFVTVAALNLFFGPDVLPSNLPPSLSSSVDIGGQQLQFYRLFVVALGAVLLLVLWFLFDRTHFGARLRAAVDNRTMAQAIGVDVTRLFSIAFALGSGLAALGGAIGFAILPLEPLYPFKYLALVLVVVSLSQFGSIRSSAVVAVLIGVADTACRYLLPVVGGFVIYVLLIGVTLWRYRDTVSGRVAS